MKRKMAERPVPGFDSFIWEDEEESAMPKLIGEPDAMYDDGTMMIGGQHIRFEPLRGEDDAVGEATGNVFRAYRVSMKTAKMTPEQMQEEIVYIADLLSTGGNSDVPENMISSYLRTQASNAERLNATVLVRALEQVAQGLDSGGSTDQAYADFREWMGMTETEGGPTFGSKNSGAFGGIEIYDNGGKTADRYTVVIDGSVYTMSENAMQPNGVNMYAGEVSEGSWLFNGAEEIISFDQLPDEVKRAIEMRKQGAIQKTASIKLAGESIDLVVVDNRVSGPGADESTDITFGVWDEIAKLIDTPGQSVDGAENIIRQYAQDHGCTYRRTGNKFIVEINSIEKASKYVWEEDIHVGDIVSLTDGGQARIVSVDDGGSYTASSGGNPITLTREQIQQKVSKKIAGPGFGPEKQYNVSNEQAAYQLVIDALHMWEENPGPEAWEAMRSMLLEARGMVADKQAVDYAIVDAERVASGSSTLEMGAILDRLLAMWDGRSRIGRRKTAQGVSREEAEKLFAELEASVEFQQGETWDSIVQGIMMGSMEEANDVRAFIKKMEEAEAAGDAQTADGALSEIGDYIKSFVDKARTAKRASGEYLYEPNPAESWMSSTSINTDRIPASGRVRVIPPPPNVPKPPSNLVYVENAETGEFIGLVGKGSLTKVGGRAEDTNTTQDKVDPKQLDMGIGIEHEHHDDCPGVSDEDLATEISLDHLSELPDYYDRLKRMEEQGKSAAFTVSNPYQGERGGKWRVLDGEDDVIDEANSAEEAEQLKGQYERGERQVNKSFVEDQYKGKGAAATASDFYSSMSNMFGTIQERFSDIGTGFDFAVTESNARLTWMDNRMGERVILNIDLGSWYLKLDNASPDYAHLMTGGYGMPTVDEIINGLDVIYDLWIQDHGSDVEPMGESFMSPDHSIDGPNGPNRLAGFGHIAAPLRFAAETDEELSPLHRFYQDRDIPGDEQRAMVEAGVSRVYEILASISDYVRVNGIQFERIESTRYAGVDNHVDRGKLYLKVDIAAGGPIARKAVLSVVMMIKDGEVTDAAEFLDASRKHRLLNREGLKAYLNLQDTPRMMRAPDVERAQIDRTMLPPTPSKSLFRGRGGVDA